MTEEEQQLIKTGAESLLKPFANLIERLFGGSVDEIGGQWQDAFRTRRLIRGKLRLVDKTDIRQIVVIIGDHADAPQHPAVNRSEANPQDRQRSHA